MRNPFRRKLETRSLDWSDFGITPPSNVSGEFVNSTTVLGLSAAWSAVGLISDSIAALPVDVLLKEGHQSIPSPDRPSWLDSPGGGLTAIDVRGQVMMSLLLRGEAFVLTPRTNGQVMGLTVLSPDEVQLDVDGNYSALGQPLEPFEIVHIRGLMLPNSQRSAQRGLSPIAHAREVFGSALATQKFGSAFFGNGAWVGSTVEVPGALSEDGQKALKAYINEQHKGSSNAHKIGVLIEGAKLSRPLTFSPEDSQFIETRSMQVADVARMFRVLPEMIGGKSTDSLTYSTLEGRSTHFVKFSLLHWIVRVEDALTRLWQSEGGPENGRIKLNVNGLLRGSTKERYDTYKIGLDAGFLQVDEVRAYEDLPPLQGNAA